MDIKTKNPYDDQYILLAHSILARYSPAEAARMLTDDDFVYREIIKETRNQDFSGPFLDCIIQSILDEKRRMEMCHEMDKFSTYLYRNLDLPRLRNELRKYGELYDILDINR